MILPPQYRSLDVCRFLAAILVAVGHYDDGFRLGLAPYTGFATRFGLFVDFFFAMSGFVIAMNYADRVGALRLYADFLWRRLARVWPLHALTTVAVAVMAAAAWSGGYAFAQPDRFRPVDLPANLALLQAWGAVWRESYNVAAWSISAEMFAYLLFPAMALAARRLSAPTALIAIAAFVLAFAWVRAIGGAPPWHQATYDLGALRALPSFFAGVLAWRHLPALRRIVPGGWRIAAGVLAAALAGVHFHWPAEIVIMLFAAFVPLAVLAEETSRIRLLGGPAARRLGDVSFGVYLLHMPVMTVGIFVMRRTVGEDGGWGPAFALLALAASCLLAVWLFDRFERPLRSRINAASPFQRRPDTLSAETRRSPSPAAP